MQLANGWGYHYLELGRKRIVYGGAACIGWNEYAHPNIAVSKICFLGSQLQCWTFCKGSHSRCGERWLQGTTQHSPTPYRLNLLWDQVSEHAWYPSFSILLYFVLLWFGLHTVMAVYVHVCIIHVHVPILQHRGCSYDISIITKLQVVHIRCKLELCTAHTPRVPCICICACNFDICSWWRLSTCTYVACHVHEQKAQHMHSRHNQWVWLWWPTKIH